MMPIGVPVSAELKAEIVALLKEGVSHRRVAAQMRVTKTSVGRIYRKTMDAETIEKRKAKRVLVSKQYITEKPGLPYPIVYGDKKYGRCETCGAKTQLPCYACYIRKGMSSDRARRAVS